MTPRVNEIVKTGNRELTNSENGKSTKSGELKIVKMELKIVNMKLTILKRQI